MLTDMYWLIYARSIYHYSEMFRVSCIDIFPFRRAEVDCQIFFNHSAERWVVSDVDRYVLRVEFTEQSDSTTFSVVRLIIGSIVP